MSSESILARLRRANPVPTAPTAGDPALFARITALPTAQGRARRARTPRRGVVLAFVLAAAVVLASTAFAISQWDGGGAVKPDVTRDEYLRAQQELTLLPFRVKRLVFEWRHPRFDPSAGHG